MDEIGIVEEISEHKVKIKLGAKEACEKCGLCKSYTPSDKNEKILSLDIEDITPQLHDTVRIEVSQGYTITGYLLLFLFPLIALILGYIIGENIFTLPQEEMITNVVEGTVSQKAPDNMYAIFMGLGFLVLSFVIIYLIEKFTGFTKKLQPKITQIIED